MPYFNCNRSTQEIIDLRLKSDILALNAVRILHDCYINNMTELVESNPVFVLWHY